MTEMSKVSKAALSDARFAFLCLHKQKFTKCCRGSPWREPGQAGRKEMSKCITRNLI